MLTDDEIMAQVFAAFQEEQSEHREAIGELLLELERNPDQARRPTMLDQLFREAHSLKGGARAAGQHDIEKLAHRIEDLFSAVRHGALELSSEVCDPVYAALDAIGVLTGQAAANQVVAIDEYDTLLQQLGAFLDTEDAAPADTAAAVASSVPVAPVPVSPPLPTGKEPALSSPSPAPEARENGAGAPENGAGTPDNLWAEVTSTTVRLPIATLDGLMNQTGELMTCTIRARQHSHDLQELAEVPQRWRTIWRQVQPAATRLQKNAPAFKPTVHHLLDRDSATRVNANAVNAQDVSILLDALNQAQALVANLENQLAGVSRQAGDDYARLAAVTDRLHDQVRRTRMLPLATLLNPLRLQAREIARGAGKHLILNIDDGGAEADRQVLEQLRDVLMHLLRNAVDHGIEAPDIRQQRGKAPVGRISIQTAVSGDHLALTLQDDGNGLDLEAIRRRAVSSGLLTAGDLDRLNDAELADLIFLPGFSTRMTVNELSGRGVGLDIVRSQIERMHGRVAVAFTPGAGTSFTLTVPLSLTSSHGLLLRAASSNFVLPLDAVQRILPVLPQEIRSIEGRAALVVDERPLALVHLSDLLGLRSSNSHQQQYLALLLGSGDRQVACIVDAILGDQELVVHRLPAPLKRVRFVAGATILADGSVVPILDVVDLIRSAIGSQRIFDLQIEKAGPQRQPTILVADDSITTRTLEKNILEAAGYRVQLATDGAEALDTIRRMAENGGCDLLISDIDMPRLNGFELTSMLRSEQQFQHLPIVLVTSLDTPADRERGIAAGADAYIVKRSFDQQLLLDTIAQLV
jgi:two-component system, chemotaxis family, sensor kinase CheA